MNDIRSLRGAEIGSDHYLARAKIRIEIVKTNKYDRREWIKWNIGKLEDSIVTEEYAKEIANNLDLARLNKNEENVNNMWEEIKNNIQKTAEKILGRQNKNKRNEWFDDECASILEEKNKAYQKMVGRYTRQNELEYETKRWEANHMFRNKKRIMILEKLRNTNYYY